MGGVVQKPAKLVIELQPDGSIHLDGPLDNPILFYGLLAAAQETYLRSRLFTVRTDAAEPGASASPPAS